MRVSLSFRWSEKADAPTTQSYEFGADGMAGRRCGAWGSVGRRRRPHRALRWPSLALCLGMCRSVLGFEIFDGFHIHGFLSQGYFFTSDNNLFGSSERGGSLDFTEIGVNASWLPLPNLQLAAQFLSRRAGEGHEGEIELDFGLADYTVMATPDRRLGVRLGRVRLPFGIYNDTRDVAFTRPSILLPQSIYFELTRELTVSADGAMFYGEQRSPWGNFMLELGPVLPRVDNQDTELAVFDEEQPGDLESRWSFIGRLKYETPGARLLLAVTGAHSTIGYRPRFSPPDDLGPGTDTFEPVVFSAQYNSEHWSLTGEYARRPIKDEGFSTDFDLELVGEGYYMQGIYRLDPRWEFVLRYDVVYADVDDRDGSKFEAEFDLPASLVFTKDWTVGVRYNFSPSLMVRAEYHNVNGTFWLFPQDNPDPLALETQWHLGALLLSYRF